MSFKVKIKNFQKIKSADLAFDPGLTVIVGATNNGKTAILRAIEAALFNKSVDSSISHGSDYAGVAVSYDENLLVWKRNKTKASKTSYKLNDSVMVKVGRGQLDEVRDAFNIKEINLLRTKEKLNFWKQMRFPFLLDRTPSQLFEFIVMSSEETNLAQVLKLMNSDIREMSGAVLVVESVIDDYTEKINEGVKSLKKFEGYPEISKEIKEEDSKVKSLVELEILCGKSGEIAKEVESYESELSIIDANSGIISGLVSELSKGFTEVDLLAKSIKDLMGFHNDMHTLLTKRNDVDRDIKKLGTVSKKDIDAYLIEEKNIEKLTGRLMGYDTLTVSLKDATLDLDKVKVEVKTVDSEIAEFKICPLCGQTLK